MASGDSVQQIKERLTIVDVVSSYVELMPAGKHMKAKCPFHNEKTPSFTLSPDRGMYYCYGCHVGGDIFTFIQEIEGVDFKEALQILADKAGVELKKEDPKKRTERDKQYDILEVATKYFQEYLTKKTEAITYLRKRGVTPETIAKWRIGYAPGPPDHGWRELKHFLESKNFTSPELLKAGLIKGADSGKEPYDLFRDRIMFPIFNAVGKVVAYSGRILTDDSKAPKYVNSPETELFNKSEILYGYDKAKQGIRSMDFSLIVEGQFDVIMAHQAGYHNTVAVSGTALTTHHVMLLQRLSNKVVLALDGDRAGVAAVKKAADLMLSRGMDVKVAHIPKGEDPADLIQKDISCFKKIIGESKHVIEFLLDILEAEDLEERTFKLRGREEVIPYVQKIPDKIDQEHFVSLLAKRLKTTQEAVRAEIQRLTDLIDLQQQQPRSATQQNDVTEIQDTTVPASDRSFGRIDELIRYLVVLIDVFPDKQKGALRRTLEKIVSKTLAQMQEQIQATQVSALSFTLEAYVDKIPQKQLYNETIDKLNELQSLLAKQEMQKHSKALQEAEREGDEDKVIEILRIISMHKKKQEDSMLTVDIFEKMPS